MPAGGERTGSCFQPPQTQSETLLSLATRQEDKAVLGRGRARPFGWGACCQAAVTQWAAQYWVCWQNVLHSDTVPPGKGFRHHGASSWPSAGGPWCHPTAGPLSRGPPSLLVGLHPRHARRLDPGVSAWSRAPECGPWLESGCKKSQWTSPGSCPFGSIFKYLPFPLKTLIF